MNGVGALILYVSAIALGALAMARKNGSFHLGLKRAIEQTISLLPNMVVVLIAAGFVVKLIPTQLVVNYMGDEAGFKAILIGSLAGLLVPSGPVMAFAIAALLADQGASVPSLISFLTSWSLYAAHRVLIFEIPLLGTGFVRHRMLCDVPLPLMAGTLALIWTVL